MTGDVGERRLDQAPRAAATTKAHVARCRLRPDGDDVMRARQRGITLIEMMMTVAIAGILVAIGVPALGSMLARSHQQSAEGALQASLMHARELAITRGVQTVVCPSADGKHCSSDDLWQGGWMIGTDADHDREPDTALARFDAMPANMRIVSSQGRVRVAAADAAHLSTCLASAN